MDVVPTRKARDAQGNLGERPPVLHGCRQLVP